MGGALHTEVLSLNYEASMRNISELLNIKYPVIQGGGMANIATAELASAVSNAGGLGLIGAGGYDKEWVRNEIRKMKSLTDKPFW